MKEGGGRRRKRKTHSGIDHSQLAKCFYRLVSDRQLRSMVVDRVSGLSGLVGAESVTQTKRRFVRVGQVAEVDVESQAGSVV